MYVCETVYPRMISRVFKWLGVMLMSVNELVLCVPCRATNTFPE
jgi:hypothetical protein